MKRSILYAALLMVLGTSQALAAAACSLSNGQAASFVLGQFNFTSNTALPVSASTVQGPRRTFSDGTRLFVSDTDNHRVLIYNSLPTSSFQAADLVLGQPDFTSGMANRGIGVAADTLFMPMGAFYDGNKLYVADLGNNRVLIWNSLPTSNGQPADLVLGQADFVSGDADRGGPPAANTLYEPGSVVLRGGKLVVADTYNHRILIWNSDPSANGQAADVVVGQADFSTNGNFCSATELYYPHKADVSGGKLIVADTNNNRYLVYNSVPTANGAAADSVIGQPNFTDNNVALGADGASWATGFTVDSAGDLWIADYGNNRVLRYSGIPSGFAPAANLELGQLDFSGGDINRNGSTTDPQADSMYWPYDVTVAGGMVYVAEYMNNRILGFSCGAATPTMTATPSPTATPTPTPPQAACPLVNGQSAVLALGQPDLLSGTLNNGGVSGSSLDLPYRLSSDGTHLIVPDAANHRVLIWNSLPTTTGQAADVVLGQANFTSNQANRGGSPAANTLNYPSAARVEGGRLVVADYSNHRVLIWNSLPTSNGQPADVVVGQADFTSNGINRGAGIAAPQADSLYQPSSCRIIGGKLFILDAYNHRVLVYNSVPAVNGAAADLVLGQSLFTTNSSGLSASKMLYPNDVESDGTRLWVVDANHNRVLGWSSFPSANGQAADFVLGQTNLFSAVQGSGTNGLYAMNALLLYNGDLFVSDYGNHRILRYSPAPSSSNPSADLVLGQADFSGISANRGGAVAANSLWYPYGMAVAGGALWVADMNNHRVLKYGCLPATTPTVTLTATPTPSATMTPTPSPTAAAAALCVSNGQAASFVLLQPDFTTNAPSNNGPRRTFSDGVRFFVADTDRHRVLIYNSLPTATGQVADLVLGQADMTGVLANRGGAVSASTMARPHGIFFDGTRLFVADTDNGRVLIWNSLPTSNGQAADMVLGQANLTSNSPNRGGTPAANTLYQPAGVSYRSGKLMVADAQNHRVLIWNSLPVSNGQAADVVVGQAGFTTNASGCGPGSLFYPLHVDASGGKMIVAEANNNRYLIFNTIPTANGALANSALGQANLTTCSSNSVGLGANSTSWGVGFTVDPAGDLWIADYGNARVLRYAGIPTGFAPTANLVLGQANFTSNLLNRTGSTTNPQANNFYFPYSVTVAGGMVYVSEAGNNRIVGFACPAATATPTVTATATVTPTPQNVYNACAAYSETWASSSTLSNWTFAGGTAGTGPYIWGPSALLVPMAGAGFVSGEYGGATYSDIDVNVIVPNPEAGYLMSNISGGLLSGEYCGQCYVLAANPGIPPLEIAIYRITGTGPSTGTKTQLALTSGPALGTAHTYALRLVKSGATLNGYVNGQLVITATDASPLPAGHAGLMGYLAAPGTVTYDHFEINPNACLSGTATATPTRTPTTTATMTPTPTQVQTPCPAALDFSPCSWTGTGQPGDLLMTMNGAGLILGLNRASGTFYYFTSTTTYIDGISTWPGDPTKIVVDRQADGKVELFNTAGVSQGIWGTTAGTNNKIGAFNPLDGSYWVPDQSAMKLFRIPAAGGAGVQINPTGTALNQPTSSIFDELGNLYITNPGSQSVMKIAAANTGLASPAATTLASGMNNLLGMVYDGNGALYAAGWAPSAPSNTSALWRIDTATGAKTLVCNSFAPLSENGGGQLYQTDGVVIDPDGNIWMTQFQNPVGSSRGLLKMSPAGVPLAYYVIPATVDGHSTGSAAPDDMAVVGQRVPRPNCAYSPVVVCSTATMTATPSPSATPTATTTRTMTFLPTATQTITVTPTATKTVTDMPTPTFTATPNTGLTPWVPSATITTTPRHRDHDEKRVDCYPNFVRGHDEKMKVSVRSFAGGACKIKIKRSNGHDCRALWQGDLQPQEAHDEDWDTRDEEGEQSPSGVYYVVFTDGDGTRQTQKVLIVR